MAWGQRSGKFYQELAEALIVFAEHTFRLSRRLPDGATGQDHAETAKRIFEKLPKPKKSVATAPSPETLSPDLPRGAIYLWKWFWEILDGVSPNGMAPASIGWRDILAWCELTGERLEAWEARLLVRLASLRTDILSEPATTPPSS
jgi:hypothetical protein